MFGRLFLKRVPVMILAAGILMGTAAFAANTYDARSENTDQILLFPGDVLFGAGELYIGEIGVGAPTGPEGEWYNNENRAYRVNVDPETGVTLLLPFGATVTVENGISRCEDLIEDTHFEDRQENRLSEDLFLLGDETPDQDVAAYPEWMTVQIQAGEASDGEVFDHWESSDEVVLEEPYSPETSFVMGPENVSLRAVFTMRGEEDYSGEDEVIEASGDEVVYDDQVPESDEEFWASEDEDYNWDYEESGGDADGGESGENEDMEEEPLDIREDWESQEVSAFEVTGAGPGSDSIFDNLDPEAITTDGTAVLDNYLEEENQPDPEPSSHQVTAEGGSILVNGNDEQITSWEFPEAEYVTVNAPERENAVFDHWESDQEDVVFLGNEGERLNWFMMPGHDVTVRAVWTQPSSETEAVAQGQVRIVSEHVYVYGDVSVSEDNQISAKEGDEVKLQADTLEDQDFDHWEIIKSSDAEAVPAQDALSPATSFEMPAEGVEVAAVYRDKPPEDHAVSIRHGDGAGNYHPGDTVIIKAQTALEGERFQKWNVSSGNVILTDENAEQTSFVMGSEDVAINAVYEYIDYNLKVTSGSGSGTYRKGEEVSLTAQWPADGKEFDTWLVNSSNASVTDPGRFTTSIVMPADHVSVQALYKSGPSVSDNLIGGISEGVSFMRGTTITFSVSGAGMENADPNPGDFRWRPSGYRIGSASGTFGDGKNTASMAINAVGNYTLYVDYVKDVFNGTSWETNGVKDTRSVNFTVTAPTAVETGDDTPILPFAAAGGAALAVILILLFRMFRKRR